MPALPAGWIAKFDQAQNSSYFINVHTGASQRRLPKGPAPSSQFAQDAELAARLQAEEHARRPRSFNNNHSIESDAALAARLQNGSSIVESDAAMAARLQAEEDARATQRPHRPQVPQQQQWGQNYVPHPSGPVYSRPSAMATGRPKNRPPKKVRWGTPLTVLVQ